MQLLTEVGIPNRRIVGLFLLSVLLGTLVLTMDRFVPMTLVHLAALGLVASALGLIVFAYPKLGLFFAVFYVYAGLSFYLHLPVAAALVALVAVATLKNLALGETLQLPSAAFNWAIAIFTVIVLQSMLFSYSPGSALSAFSVFLKALLMVYLAVQLIRTPRDLELFALAIFVGSVGTVLLGFLNVKLGLISDSSTIGVMGWLRFSGTHSSPNHAALYMVSGIPLGIYALTRCRTLRTRVLVGFGVILLFLATIMTFSRGAMLPLGIVMLAILVHEARSKKVFLLVLLAAAVVMIVSPAYTWYRLLTIGDILAGETQDWSLMLRVKAAKLAWGLFLDHPLTGIGLHSFKARSGAELFVKIGPHNTYLDMLAGVGLIGFGAYMTIHWITFKALRRAIKTRWDSTRQWMGGLSFYFLLSYVSALVSAIFMDIPFYYSIWLPMAAGLAAERFAHDAEKSSSHLET